MAEKKKDFLDKVMEAPGKIMDGSSNVISKLSDAGEKATDKISKKLKKQAEKPNDVLLK